MYIPRDFDSFVPLFGRFLVLCDLLVLADTLILIQQGLKRKKRGEGLTVLEAVAGTFDIAEVGKLLEFGRKRQVSESTR